jgi:hypothetical protein
MEPILLCADAPMYFIYMLFLARLLGVEVVFLSISKSE